MIQLDLSAANLGRCNVKLPVMMMSGNGCLGTGKKADKLCIGVTENMLMLCVARAHNLASKKDRTHKSRNAENSTREVRKQRHNLCSYKEEEDKEK